MPAFLKTGLKYVGYGAFFVVALVFFVYLTLPLDAVEDYLVRKASDEYNADLQITTLSTWRLTGFEAEGVTITPRPTSEQLEEMRLGREARAAWMAKQEEKKATGAKAGKVDPALPPGAKGTDPTAAAGAVGKADPTATGAVATGAKDDKKGASASKKDDKPPPVPRGPQALHIDTLRARVAPLDLLSGTIDGHLEATLLNGELSAEVMQKPTEVGVKAEWSNLDLAQLDVLEKFLPLPLVGALGGDVDLVVPVDDKHKMLLINAEGTIGLRIQNASIGPGQIESKKLGAFPYFDVPKTRIQDLSGKVVFAAKKATFEDFEFTGKDLEGEITGYIKLANKFEQWTPRAHLRFKFSDTFMDTHSAVKTAMTSVPYLKQGQRDGYTGFAVTGTISKMRWQPRKDSPHKPARRSAKPATVKKGQPSKVDRTSTGVTPKVRDRKSMRDFQRPSATGGTGSTGRPILDRTDRPTTLPPIDTQAARDDEPAEDEEPEEEPETDTATDEPEAKTEDSDTKGEGGKAAKEDGAKDEEEKHEEGSTEEE